MSEHDIHDLPHMPDQVKCPAPGCSMDMMHPIKVSVNRGGEVTTINEEGTKIGKGKTPADGVVIAITFACECGNVSAVFYHFSHGATSTGVKDYGWFGPEDEDGDDPHSHTIWRN